ncbi:uncharacterized protein LOC127862710 [Dreissena polymorpha]|uniref:uncharacterized protein LOC127862710 n=1 Tax=Dreissena polymorpha TaxID=45954 RepID=UPI0022656063|nr:uncharacterized protein LOC127862710 [Dreissena polymorpha]
MDAYSGQSQELATDLEKQPLPPTSSYDKYFKLSLSGKELTFTIPDVKTPVMADSIAEYDLYQDLTDDRLFSINISHKFDHRVVNFTVKGKELEKTNTIEILKAPNATYDVGPNMKIVIAIDVITNPNWQHQISYKWFWYLPVTTATGDQIIEKQPLPPTSSYEKYFKLSLSGKELTFTIPDVKTPVKADNTAEYDLYQDLTDDRLFSINISHKFDYRVVNFTVKGKELEKTKASTSQAHVYIGIGLGAVVLVVTAAVIIFKIQKEEGIKHGERVFRWAAILYALQTMMYIIRVILLTKRMSQKRTFNLTTRNQGSH